MSETSLAVEAEIVTRKPRERIVTLALEGEVGERELAEIHASLFRISHRGTRNVVIDFTEVGHIDYRCVRPLLAKAEQLRAAGGDIKLSGLSPYLKAIFRSVGAHEAFELFTHPHEARNAFERDLLFGA